MKFNKPLLFLWSASLSLSGGLSAQELLPAKGFPLVIESAQNRLLPSGEQGSIKIPVYGNGSFSVNCDAGWLQAGAGKNYIGLSYTANPEAGQRSAVVNIKNASNVEQNLVISQPGNATLEHVVSNWLRIFPTSYKANQSQPGADIALTQDGNYGTNYHSPWKTSISEENPAILTYYFDTPQHLDLVNYVPVNGNGKFGLVDIYYKQGNASDFSLLGQYDFNMVSTPTAVYFGSQGKDNITCVEFRVKTGYSFTPGIQYYATCAEMEFKRELTPNEIYQEKIKNITAVSEGVPAQEGEDISKTLDSNFSTLFHTNYSQAINSEHPAILTYTLSEPTLLEKVVYVPRKNLRDDNTPETNGNFGQVEVLYTTENETTFTTLLTKDFGKASTNTEIDFSSVQDPVTSVRFIVTSGGGNFASCAEMEFYEAKTYSSDYSIFGDDVYTQLKDGVTQTDIDAITDPFVKGLAQDLYDHNYNTDYRVADYPCLLSPQALSAEWNTPGKLYDQLQGVTGINISKGKNVIIVSGAATDIPLILKVVSWYNGNGKDPVEHDYTLINGINTINYEGEYDGLAYISYYAGSNPEQYSPVKVHFVYGQVNGYLSPDKTNEEMHQLCANARNTCMDLVGEHVHSIWTARGLYDYCKASDGSSLGYRQYMNLLDTLIGWEHQLLGFKKYNRVPQNKTMAYVNYTNYMFQGGYGVSFKYDQEERVLNCRRLMYDDSDAIWGLSHEWGHQHQMQPYFCWAGLGESSNNMNSCYNVLHMGYTSDQASRIQDNWTAAYNHLLLGNTTKNSKKIHQYVGTGKGDYVKNGDIYEFVGENAGDYIYEETTYGPGAVADKRNMAYTNRAFFNWCPAIQTLIDQQFKYGLRIPAFDDTEKTVSTNELYVEENTAAFFMLYCYFSDKNHADYVKDFQEDLYEALRQNDNPEGSTVEKKDGVDKYELLASAQNGNKNGKYEVFASTYPQSCWITEGYLTENAQWTQNSVPFIFNYIRKASRLCGYNLFDYFDKMGFLRTIVLAIDDYGMKYYALTADMKAEFKTDMENLGLKPLTSDMIEKITHANIPTFSTPVIPN